MADNANPKKFLTTIKVLATNYRSKSVHNFLYGLGVLRHDGVCPRPGLLFLGIALYLLYVDASGTPLVSDVNSSHYVLTGVAVHEGTWFAPRKTHFRIEAAAMPFSGEDFELHVDGLQ